ncbi:MAG: hypothetical protein ACK55I_22565, partial [bacterium]
MQQGEASRRLLGQIVRRIDDQHRLLHPREALAQIVCEGRAMTPVRCRSAAQPLGKVARQHRTRHFGPGEPLQVLPCLDTVATVLAPLACCVFGPQVPQFRVREHRGRNLHHLANALRGEQREHDAGDRTGVVTEHIDPR